MNKRYFKGQQDNTIVYHTGSDKIVIEMRTPINGWKIHH